MIEKIEQGYHLTCRPHRLIPAVLNNKQACKDYSNCISGTFQFQGKANAILYRWGTPINNLSAHGWLDFPDTVIAYYYGGTIKCFDAVKLTAEQREDIVWAISGMGLIDHYSPRKQGYCKGSKDGYNYNYSDVVRKTAHTVLGYKDGEMHGFYLSNMSGKQVDTFCRSQGLDFAIMLDGGHVAGCNCDAGRANSKLFQHNILQFVQG